MATVDLRRRSAPSSTHPRSCASVPGSVVVRWITSTDHKTIGYMYLVTSFAWFIIGGILALLIRAELFEPGIQVVQSRRAVQPAVHDARHDHAVAVRDAAVRGIRERHHAAADRRARRGVPAPQHAGVLVLLLRRNHRGRGVLHALRARPPSAGSPTRRCPTPRTRRASAETCGSSAWRSVVSAPSSVRSTSSPPS